MTRKSQNQVVEKVLKYNLQIKLKVMVENGEGKLRQQNWSIFAYINYVM
jgi:hypothetical protein